jgi:hypothetical protein
MSDAKQATLASADDELLKQLYALDASLRAGREEVLNLLAHNSKSDIRDLRYVLFGCICDKIYNAAKEFHHLKEDFPFYIWPGYNSIRYKDPSERRVQLSHFWGGSTNNEMECGVSPAYKITTLLKQGINSDASQKHPQTHTLNELRDDLRIICDDRKKWPCLKPGILPTTGLTSLYDGENEVFRFFATPCSIFFSLLLHDPSPDGSFIPGSTHRWLIENKGITIDNYGSKHILSGLAVHYEDSPKKTPGDASYFPITLKAQDLCVSGLCIADKLNKLEGIEYKWPAPISGQNDTNEDNDILRRRLYSPWLTSVFAPHKLMESTDMMRWDEFWDSDKKPAALLNYLEFRFKEGKQRLDDMTDAKRTYLLDWITYKHWISLALDGAPETVGSKLASMEGNKTSSLGSIMLFSEQALTFPFLTIVRNWIQEIYLLFRQHESMKRMEEVGEADNAAAVNQAISHEFKKIVPLITDSPKWVRTHIKDWLLAFALPGFSVLDKANDSKFLPPALHYNKAQTYKEWLKGLSVLAAEIESVAIPGGSSIIPSSEAALKSNVATLAGAFSFDNSLEIVYPPSSFSERCLLGIAILCVFRNCIKHTTTYMDRYEASGEEVYGTVEFSKSDCKIICCVRPASEAASEWGDFDLVTTNHNCGDGYSETGGSTGAIRYYLGQIKKKRGLSSDYPYLHPVEPDECGIHTTLLPSLLLNPITLLNP